MKAIFVATDLSERSDRAVRRAVQLAKAHGARCHVLHVIDDVMPDEMATALRDDAQARLCRFVDSLGGGEAVTCATVVGDPLIVIHAQAKAFGADLVVFGLHRPRAFLDRLRETTVERLVRLTDRPVLLVRDPADHDYSRVLVPVSFSAACATALTAARRLAPEAKLSAVHAIHLPFAGLTHERPGGAMDRELTAEAEATRSTWCTAQGLAPELCQVEPVTGSLREVVNHQMRQLKPDLIAIGAHTRGGLAPYALGSFAADLVRDPPTDLLLVRP